MDVEFNCYAIVTICLQLGVLCLDMPRACPAPTALLHQRK